MALFLLTRTDYVNWDENAAMVISDWNGPNARRRASEQLGCENARYYPEKTPRPPSPWLDETRSTCRYIGACPKEPHGVLCRDFRAR